MELLTHEISVTPTSGHPFHTFPSLFSSVTSLLPHTDWACMDTTGGIGWAHVGIWGPRHDLRPVARQWLAVLVGLACSIKDKGYFSRRGKVVERLQRHRGQV